MLTTNPENTPESDAEFSSQIKRTLHKLRLELAGNPLVASLCGQRGMPNQKESLSIDDYQVNRFLDPICFVQSILSFVIPLLL